MGSTDTPGIPQPIVTWDWCTQLEVKPSNRGWKGQRDFFKESVPLVYSPSVSVVVPRGTSSPGSLAWVKVIQEKSIGNLEEKNHSSLVFNDVCTVVYQNTSLETETSRSVFVLFPGMLLQDVGLWDSWAEGCGYHNLKSCWAVFVFWPLRLY